MCFRWVSFDLWHVGGEMLFLIDALTSTTRTANYPIRARWLLVSGLRALLRIDVPLTAAVLELDFATAAVRGSVGCCSVSALVRGTSSAVCIGDFRRVETCIALCFKNFGSSGLITAILRVPDRAVRHAGRPRGAGQTFDDVGPCSGWLRCGRAGRDWRSRCWSRFLRRCSRSFFRSLRR